MDIVARADLPFPRSLPEFQRVFPDDAAWLERARWPDGFTCPHCGTSAEACRFAARPGVLRCRSCRRDTRLTAGTVLHRSQTPLSTWFWGAPLVVSQTRGLSATQFQRQLGLSRYETAFGILHKLRAGMVRPDRDRIGGQGSHVEVDETWVGGRTRGEGRGVHHKTPVAGAVESAVAPGATVVTDDWAGDADLAMRGYGHRPVVQHGDPAVTEEFLPIVHLVFSNLKTWLGGTRHGVSPKHLQAHLNEFAFRFNRRFWPFNAFRSLLGIAAEDEAPTCAGLHEGEWHHPHI